MKKIFYILVGMGVINCVAMEEPSLLQMYKNWAYARTLTHFIPRGQEYNSETRPLEQCRYISIKELHDALDGQIKRHLFINYVVAPAITIASVATAAGVIVYKNL